MRLSQEEKIDRVFDELSSGSRLNIEQLARRSRMKRVQVSNGIRGNREILGDQALVCNADGTYELAMTDGVVKDYRYRRLKFVANSLKTLLKVIEAGGNKFGPNPDVEVSIAMIRTAIQMLERGMGGDKTSTHERVH
jgi:hypothetical protein